MCILTTWNLPEKKIKSSSTDLTENKKLKYRFNFPQLVADLLINLHLAEKKGIGQQTSYTEVSGAKT